MVIRERKTCLCMAALIKRQTDLKSEFFRYCLVKTMRILNLIRATLLFKKRVKQQLVS